MYLQSEFVLFYRSTANERKRSVYKNSFWFSRHASQYAGRLIIHSRAKLSIFFSFALFFFLLSNRSFHPAFINYYNIQCRNKVDYLWAIHLFSYFTKFSFYLSPSYPSSWTRFPLNFYDHSRREWRTAGTAIENGDGDIGIPLTFANYTLKIDSPVVYIEKFSRDSTNLGVVATESYGLIANLLDKCWRC